MRCKECGTWTCDRCHKPTSHASEPFLLPCPFGSFNAKYPVEVCRDCYREYAKLGWSWVNRDPMPPDVVWETWP